VGLLAETPMQSERECVCLEESEAAHAMCEVEKRRVGVIALEAIDDENIRYLSLSKIKV
jgi:hypothetical protein